MGNMQGGGGFQISKPMVMRMMFALLYGDVLLRVGNRCRPYETTPGFVDNLCLQWIERLRPAVQKMSFREFGKNVRAIVADFDSIPLDESVQRPKVGVVGEILVKFHPDANNQLVRVIEKEGGEAVVPDFIDFVLYCFLDDVQQHKILAGNFKDSITSNMLITLIEWFRNAMRKAYKRSKRFSSMENIWHISKLVDGLVSHGNQTGEGWLLTAEMVELIESGAPNIVLVQPFACLPNHITGKGVMKELKRRYENANIVAVDYDPGATEVNQLNRIKLMMSVAFQNMKKESLV
jgi:predicted nucleotide-binding protein (sugar kinase/HSP70/actin superfamily)